MRPTKPRHIGCAPPYRHFRPMATAAEQAEALHGSSPETVIIGLDMLEAMRLVDVEGLNQEDAAKRMDVSAPTLCRILGQGRRRTAQALTTGNSILLEGGNIVYSERQGRHGHHFCSGRGGWQHQGAMQDAHEAGKGHGHGKGRGCHNSRQGKCEPQNQTSAIEDTAADDL